ncbi:phosphate system positive regulatory protein pho81, partial [Kappamyces sp. JEL0680]
MKFGKFILSVSTEWTNYYINYKALKKIIKDKEDTAVSEASPSLLPLAQPTPATALEIAPDSASTQASQLEQSHTPAQVLDTRKTRFFWRLERELEKVNAFYIQKENELKIRLDALSKKTSVTSSLKDAFLQFQADLAKLQKFVQINATGFRKILKKWDKRSK